MADVGETDGGVNIDHDHGASPELSPGEFFVASDGPHENITSIVSSKSRVFRMDHNDEDGAPTSSSTSTKHKRDDLLDMEGGENKDRIVSFDSSAESTPRKSSKKIKPSTVTSPQTPQRGQDLSSVDMKSSWDGSAAGLLADPAKIAKEREKEERVRQARERLMEERQKKLEELREMQKMAQENREKQLEMRRKKIEDLRKRDIERRIAVEERRKMKEEVERARRESILQKAEERVARYEAWKAGGRKGTTASTSTAATPATHYYPRPTIMPHGINPLALASMTASLPSPVRMREAKASRKPRPASVASCMPSFFGGEMAKSRRSKSTDRQGRDRSRTRQSRREEVVGKNAEDARGQADESGEKVQGMDAGKEHGETREKKDRVSLSFSSRSSSKHKRKDQEQVSKESAPKKDGPIVRKSSFREKQSPTHLKEPGSRTVPSKDAHRSSIGTSEGPLPSTARASSPARRETDKPAVRMTSPSFKGGGERSTTPNPFITPPPSATSTPTVPAPSSAPALVASASSTPSQSLTTSFADDGVSGSRVPVQDISADEYKARLAEKRRQAREKAEREAEEERRRQEEARLAEEERQRKEEEDELKFEEESLRLAEEAHQIERERLQRAIEAEEKRRREEAEKLEQEKRSKEEAERKARAESERLEKEKQERARKEDEERLERKKKLEMIMKRVKTDTDSQPKQESPTKSTIIFPAVTHLISSQNSPEEEQKSVVSSELSDDEAPVAEGSAVLVYSDDMTMSFMQDFEQEDFMSSASMSTSVTANSLPAGGNILDSLSFRGDDHKRAGDGHVSSLPGETDTATIWSDVAQRLEDERQNKIREAEKMRTFEAGRLEQARIAKEETERRRSSLTNHVEKNRQELGRKEDEERLARKKKLEMIMKRVKTDTDSQPKQQESPTKPASSYSAVTHFSSSQSSPEEEQRSVVSSELSDDEMPGLSVAEGSAVQVYSDSMTMSFMQDFEQADMTASTSSSASTVTRSFSSGNILDGPSFRNEEKDNNVDERSQSAGNTPSTSEEKAISSEASSDTKPRFKSPLLQHLVENKGNDSSAPKFKSPLLQNLLSKTKVGARMGLSASASDLSPSRETPSSQTNVSTSMTVSSSSVSSDVSPREVDKPDGEQNRKSFDRYMFTNGIGKDSGDSNFQTSSSKSSFDSPPFEGTKLSTPMSDSALGSSIEPYGDVAMSPSAVVTNGHGNYSGHVMEDSSINPFYTEEGITKSHHTSFETLAGGSDRQEEDFTRQSDGQSQDLIDFCGPEIRTFEENSRSDVTDYLS